MSYSYFLKRYKTGVINDPLGQPTVLAGSDCRLFLKLCQTDRSTTCVKIVITTGWDCGQHGSIKLKLTTFCEKSDERGEDMTSNGMMC